MGKSAFEPERLAGEGADLVWDGLHFDMAPLALNVVAGKPRRTNRKDMGGEDLVGIRIHKKGSDGAGGSYQEVLESSGGGVLRTDYAVGARIQDNEDILVVVRTRQEEVACTPWPLNLACGVDGQMVVM